MAMVHRLRDIREEQGLTLREVAERAGVSLQTVQRAETGETAPFGRTLYKLARALGVPITALRECGPVPPAEG